MARLNCGQTHHPQDWQWPLPVALVQPPLGTYRPSRHGSRPLLRKLGLRKLGSRAKTGHCLSVIKFYWFCAVAIHVHVACGSPELQG